MKREPTERDEAIARMFKASYSYDDIARALGLTRNQVAGVCHRRGLKRPVKQPIISEAEQAERAIDQRDLDILCDVKEGHSRRQIAKHWGVSESFVGRLIEAARAAE